VADQLPLGTYHRDGRVVVVLDLDDAQDVIDMLPATDGWTADLERARAEAVDWHRAKAEARGEETCRFCGVPIKHVAPGAWAAVSGGGRSCRGEPRQHDPRPADA
jgi:hypothetical protein